MWREKLKLGSDESLRHESSHSHGPLGEEDVDIYAVISVNGDVVGSVEHRDHTAIQGFRRTISVIQKDASRKTIVEEHWTE